jgi:hypothetical protein
MIPFPFPMALIVVSAGMATQITTATVVRTITSFFTMRAVAMSVAVAMSAATAATAAAPFQRKMFISYQHMVIKIVIRTVSSVSNKPEKKKGDIS